MSDLTYLVLPAVVVLVIGYIIYRAFANIFGGRGKVATSGGFVCPSCGTRGEPKRCTKGSTLIEIILWLCLIVPGVIYSLWRVTSRESVCPACGSTMIPVNTPRGRQLTSQQ